MALPRASAVPDTQNFLDAVAAAAADPDAAAGHTACRRGRPCRRAVLLEFFCPASPTFLVVLSIKFNKSDGSGLAVALPQLLDAKSHAAAAPAGGHSSTSFCCFSIQLNTGFGAG